MSHKMLMDAVFMKRSKEFVTVLNVCRRNRVLSVKVDRRNQVFKRTKWHI